MRAIWNGLFRKKIFAAAKDCDILNIMEECSIDVAKLKTVIDDFRTGNKTAKQFDPADYTDPELDYIMRELGNAVMRELDGLIEDVGEYEEQEQAQGH
jgi:hypothetical protein